MLIYTPWQRTALFSAIGVNSLGLGVSAWQSWLQVNPPESAGCVLKLSWMDHLQAAGDCSKVDTVYFGLSLAQWSATFFLMLLMGCVLGYALTED